MGISLQLYRGALMSVRQATQRRLGRTATRATLPCDLRVVHVHMAKGVARCPAAAPPLPPRLAYRSEGFGAHTAPVPTLFNKPDRKWGGPRRPEGGGSAGPREGLLSPGCEPFATWPDGVRLLMRSG